MKKIWTDSPSGLRVDRKLLEKKAQNKEFLGNRDFVLPTSTEAYRKGWDRIFGNMPNMRKQ